MDVNLLKGAFTGIEELVREAARNKDNLPGLCLQGGRGNREGGAALLDDKDLLKGCLCSRTPSPGDISTQINETAAPPYS